MQAISIIKRFKPDVVVSAGGYASGPAMIAVGLSGLPSVAVTVDGQNRNQVARYMSEDMVPA